MRKNLVHNKQLNLSKNCSRTIILTIRGFCNRAILQRLGFSGSMLKSSCLGLHTQRSLGSLRFTPRLLHFASVSFHPTNGQTTDHAGHRAGELPCYTASCVSALAGKNSIDSIRASSCRTRRSQAVSFWHACSSDYGQWPELEKFVKSEGAT